MHRFLINLTLIVIISAVLFYFSPLSMVLSFGPPDTGVEQSIDVEPAL